MRLPGSRRGAQPRPPLPRVVAGEKVLAHAVTGGGAVVAGTRDALYLPADPPADRGPGWVRLRWEEVESADWDADKGVLRVLGVGTWGEVRPEHAVSLERPDRLLQLVRERVTASIVLQRRVPVRGGRGLTVVGRRAPAGGPLRWFHEYDQGVDPDDPEVRRLAADALARAREEAGD